MRFAALYLAIIAFSACRMPISREVRAPIAPCPAPEIDVADWEVVAARSFSFRLPPAFRAVPSTGIDSYVRRFEANNGTAVVSLDYGSYSDPLDRTPGTYVHYARCSEVINGHPATVITGMLDVPTSSEQHGRQMAAATWRNVNGRAVHLTIGGETRDPRQLRDILAMLRTVEIHAR